MVAVRPPVPAAVRTSWVPWAAAMPWASAKRLGQDRVRAFCGQGTAGLAQPVARADVRGASGALLSVLEWACIDSGRWDDALAATREASDIAAAAVRADRRLEARALLERALTASDQPLPTVGTSPLPGLPLCGS